jgi:hypothetical protein
VGDAQVA